MAGADTSLPVLPSPTTRSRWRMAVLVGVHVLIAAHLAHYALAGRTVSPLEPSEAREALGAGIINAGALFFALLILTTALFGRFFCGWGCHVVFYQDVMRGLLLRMGVAPQAPRSRVLAWVPVFAAVWLFGIPLFERWRAPVAAGWTLHTTTDAFWRTFPDVPIALITVAVCGLVVVVLWGSKGFCAYGCPYGAIFGAVDRVAPGRIRVTDACDGSAACTRHCSSNIDVAGEVARYGMVVNPGCLKCMDCITACPNDALYYGFTPRVQRPAPPPRAQPRDFTAGEEALAGVAFIAVFAVTNQLYRRIPFLLAVGIAVIGALLVVVAWRVARRPDVAWQGVVLKQHGRVRRAGWACWALVVAGAVLWIHSAAIQWHWYRGRAAFAVARQQADDQRGVAPEAATLAWGHLDRCARWGLIHTRGLGRTMGQIALWRDDPKQAVAWFDRDLQAGSRNEAGILKGHALLRVDDSTAARRAYRAAFARAHLSSESLLAAARDLGAEGYYLAQHEVLMFAFEQHPHSDAVALALCRVLMRCPDRRLIDFDAALRVASSAVARAADANVYLLGTLAALHGQHRQWDEGAAVAARAEQRARELGLIDVAGEMADLAATLQANAVD